MSCHPRVMERGIGWKHPRLPCHLGKVWQSYSGIFKPKLGVPCLPGVGLTLHPRLSPSVAGRRPWEQWHPCKASSQALGQLHSWYVEVGQARSQDQPRGGKFCRQIRFGVAALCCLGDSGGDSTVSKNPCKKEVCGIQHFPGLFSFGVFFS